MAVRIEASFLLGTYQGHRADGSADDLPDPARLHAALVAAAGSGPRAIVDGDDLVPSPNDQAALRWLENNPPQRIVWPPHRKVAPGNRIAYRREGVIVKEARVIKDKVVGRQHSDATALGGPVVWEWSTMPSVVRECLGHLCPEVPCLGESTSPVRLRVTVGDDVNSTPVPAGRTLVLELDQASLNPRVVDLRVPQVGRTTALIDAHKAARAGSPRPRQDGHAWTAYPTPNPVAAGGLRYAAYAPELPPAPDLPWTRVILIPLIHQDSTEEFPEEDRVLFAVSVHRALIARIGTGAVPTITGAYSDTVLRRPPNRLAIHYLPSSVTALMDPPDGRPPDPMLAMLVPVDCDVVAEEQIAKALHGWRHIRHVGKDVALDVERMEALPADRIWRAPLGGTVRRWITVVPAIPETRPQELRTGQRWTLADAAAVSAGLLWRDDLDDTLNRRGPELFAHLRQAVSGLGFRVRDLAQVTRVPARRYVHATPQHLLIQPYRALLDMGDLLPDRGIVALGQSRHLGGGLLIPFDVPVAMTTNEWEPSR